MLPLFVAHRSPFESPGVVSMPGYWSRSPFVLTVHSPFVRQGWWCAREVRFEVACEQFEYIDRARLPSDLGHVFLELGGEFLNVRIW